VSSEATARRTAPDRARLERRWRELLTELADSAGEA
jgi:hypothetical protein